MVNSADPNERGMRWVVVDSETAGKEWDRWHGPTTLRGVEAAAFAVGEKMATRKASEKVLNLVGKVVPNLVGGSADLSPSNNTVLKGAGDFTTRSREGRNFHFGVREHGMGAIVNGMALHGGLRPYCATFLVFSDYLRPAMRLAAMMRLPITYVFTHDSIGLGEDGPPHQPIEHSSGLLGIEKIVVNASRMLERFLNGRFGDLVKNYSLRLLVLAKTKCFRQMPGDCLSFAVLVSCQYHRV